MKRKTVFAVLISIALLFTLALTAGAGTFKQVLERYPAGDIDHDGAVTSNDSRYILRESVGLEIPEMFSKLISDTDGDGVITAADARKSLRTSVGMEKMHYHHFAAVIPGSNCFRCSDCGYSFVDEKCEHSFALSCVSEQPSCRGGSVKTYVCIFCGDTKEEVLPKTSDHVYDSGVTVKKATCAETGVKTYTCRVCGDVKTEIVSKTGVHSFDSGKTTKKATCKSTGTVTYTCKVCGAVRTKNTERLSTHTYDAGKMTIPATCTQDGVRTYTCTVCGAQRTEAVKAAGHRFEKAAEGITHCVVCGAGTADESIKMKCISIGERIVFLGEDISSIVSDFGNYTRSDRVFKDITAYSFAGDYSNYFIALCKDGRAVGYYVLARDFSSAFYGKGDKTTVTVKRTKDGIRIMPFIDRAHDHGVYALMIAFDEYIFSPDLGNKSFFAHSSKQIFDMTNAYRAQFGLSALTWSDPVADIARGHSDDMAASDYLEHADQDGKMPWQRAADAGIDYVYYAENIAGGSGLSYMTFDQWVNSKNHNEVLLSDCVLLGVGGAYNEKTKFGFYWTQNFAQLG